MAVWTSAAADREGHEQSFLDEVRTFHVVPEFRTIADLQRQVEERISDRRRRPGALVQIGEHSVPRHGSRRSWRGYKCDGPRQGQ